MFRAITKGAFVAAVLASFAGTRVLANGAGFDVGVGGFSGGLVAGKDSSIRLVSEELTIHITKAKADLQRKGEILGTYAVHARYLLSNKDDPKTVHYGVPILIPSQSVPPEPDPATEVAKTVNISLAQAKAPCTFVKASDPAASRFPILWPRLTTLHLEGWCVTDLLVPHGDSVELTLEYEGQLATHEDWMEGPNGGADLDSRRGPFFYYPLGPAASWAGTPDQVRAEIALEGFSPQKATIFPDGAQIKGNTITWTWKKPSLRGMEIVLDLPYPKDSSHKATELRMPWDDLGNAKLGMPLGHHPGPDPGTVVTRASSQLPGSGRTSYGPANAVDGALDTAWCVNNKDGGVGEWIEIEFPLGPPRLERRSLSVYLVPGYAKSEWLYETNSRVDAVKIGPCGAGSEMTRQSLWVPKSILTSDPSSLFTDLNHARAALDLILQKASDGKACFRLEIAHVVPGTGSKAVCISEIAFPVTEF
jgi:hypothetical protein